MLKGSLDEKSNDLQFMEWHSQQYPSNTCLIRDLVSIFFLSDLRIYAVETLQKIVRIKTFQNGKW